MLVRTSAHNYYGCGVKSDNKVTICDLVEHPGGHDGGEFPQYHDFTVSEDGTVVYSTAAPVCSNDSFVDEDVFILADTAEDALVLLKDELDDLEKNRSRLQNLIAKLEAGADFEVQV